MSSPPTGRRGSSTVTDSELMQGIEKDFNWLVEDRRLRGAKEYGTYKFLDNDTLSMMYEELADIVNYCTFTYVKLRLLEERVGDALRSDSPDTDAELDPE